MDRDDIANVSLVSKDELLEAVGEILDACGFTARMEDLTSRWQLGPISPEDFAVSEPAPFKSHERYVRDSTPRTVPFKRAIYEDLARSFAGLAR